MISYIIQKTSPTHTLPMYVYMYVCVCVSIERAKLFIKLLERIKRFRND